MTRRRADVARNRFPAAILVERRQPEPTHAPDDPLDAQEPTRVASRINACASGVALSPNPSRHCLKLVGVTSRRTLPSPDCSGLPAPNVPTLTMSIENACGDEADLYIDIASLPADDNATAADDVIGHHRVAPAIDPATMHRRPSPCREVSSILAIERQPTI